MILDIRKAGPQADFRARILRSTALIALSAIGVVASPAAFGQAQSGSQQAASSSIEEVVVTGTRIVRDGYSAPTPVTVVGQEQLQSSATGNIADYVNTMPVFYGSSTPTNGYHNSSNALAGLNTLNLRSLGASRTLVLIDGQRSVGSTTTGLVDINNIPQDLVTRVDVVTGGASAVYGSDALSGVVNFVLDKTFVGTKGELSGGVTTYGDDMNWKARLTEGIAFAGDRGHLIVSGELSDDPGIKGVPRAWNKTGQAYMLNPSYVVGNGQPQYLRTSQVSLYTATFGGIITNTALANTQFGPGGTPSMFHLGAVTDSPYTSGGDWASNQAIYDDLVPSQMDQRIFGRASYQLTDNINIFGQVSWAGTHTKNGNEPIFYLGNLTVKSDNAFIPASVATQLNAQGITQFSFGTFNGDLPHWQNDAYRTTSRYVLGADGKFGAFGTDWTWNVYYQQGDTYSQFQVHNVTVASRYMAAIDAVRSPATGAIVCRSTLINPNDGCVPYDLFGTGVNSQAAINYVEPSTPSQHLSLRQDVASGNISGEPFSDWAGPISIAASIEHRREATKAVPDAAAGTYFAANYAAVAGSYGVTEGSLETVVPLARDEVWAKALDLNAAVRVTDYTTSGMATTWKVGATWDVTSDIRLRATQSHDIRAPNLSELFQAGAGGTGTIFDDFRGRTGVLYRIVQQGNLNLVPEAADSTGAGVVVQPSFLPGFSASIDYWKIDIKHAIGSIGQQSLFDLCFQGQTQLCPLISPNPATLTAVPASYNIISEPINLASQNTAGFDLEASYRVDLDDLVQGWAGNFALRYLGTYYNYNKTNNSLVPVVNAAGASIPRWRHNITATYSGDPFTISLTGRITTSGIIDPTFVTCTTGCPASTLNNPTVSNNNEPGSFYLDTSMNYALETASGMHFQAYFNVQNLLNKDPAIVPLSYTGVVPYFSIQTNPTLYDVMGRTFRLGVRFNL